MKTAIGAPDPFDFEKNTPQGNFERQKKGGGYTNRAKADTFKVDKPQFKEHKVSNRYLNEEQFKPFPNKYGKK